ncbi:transposable element Tcb1 transposase [Trichonephila clavipes]|uniref:Transposable element Tcb1 transposase n=1 Tax=Trichonephila clavipes TaxID=2585209 RepID=A0A8X6SN47_TRICX|nr:transposable element Tcb1 transposase [Trichonephila clavipes]
MASQFGENSLRISCLAFIQLSFNFLRRVCSLVGRSSVYYAQGYGSIHAISISETVKLVNSLCAAVVKVYHAWRNGTVQNQRRGKCGAPRAIDDRGERRMRRCVRANRRAAVEKMIYQMNQGSTNSVFQTTVRRTMLRLGLRSRRLVHAPMPTVVQRQ